MATRFTIPILLFLFTITLSRARDLQNPLPESNSQTTTRSKPQQYDTVTFNLNSVDHVPLTFLDFRPINRHIRPQQQHQQRSLPFDFPLSHHRCRHGHRRQIPYGNDMILSNDANIKDRRISKRFTKIRDGEMFYPQVMSLYPHHIHSHHQDQDHDHDHHHHHHHHHEKGWFAKKIHELLNLF
ncbi:hypothetical protein TSUD_132160 [Trifolium subterraneum]|uniref:Uncharacterized protein n=1 Tax=Trifolium subterraneum TaxID=3900 RepID=A0A2Z6LKN8_TRISU|nr:hypothetical protein TSUD_132160 [Trifolium subterraneum]